MIPSVTDRDVNKVVQDRPHDAKSSVGSGAVLFCILLLVVELLNFAWAICDRSLPVWDEAEHLYNGLVCRSLLLHPNWFDLGWYKSLLTVSPLYPPFTYLVYGTAKAVLGTGRWIDVLIRFGFIACLFSSTWGLGWLIFESSSVASVASVLVCTYPSIFWFGHLDNLDSPALATTALALFCFTYWLKKPSYRRVLCLGLSFGIACITKHICLAFLAPLAISIAITLIKARRGNELKQLLLAGLVSVLIAMPWLTAAAPDVLKTIGTVQQQQFQSSFLNNFVYYVSSLSGSCSPLLFGLFVISLFLSTATVHKNMRYLNISVVGALICLSCFRWVPSSRYGFPMLIVLALYSANGIVLLYRGISHKAGLFYANCVALLLLSLIALQFVLTNFSPYPIRSGKFGKHCERLLSIRNEPPFYLNAQGPPIHPVPLQDNGDAWVLSSLSAKPSSLEQTLVVMPNSPEVSASSYRYLVMKDSLNIHVWASRTWTILGDSVTFDPQVASSAKWCLLKTGPQGFVFCDTRSATEYALWCNFIRKSGLFTLYGSHPMSDGSELMLYHHR